MIFMERMKKNEAMQMYGFGLFSEYGGYSDNLYIIGPYTDTVQVSMLLLWCVFTL